MKILELFQEDNGALSAIRLLLFVVYINVLVNWNISCYHEGKLVDIPGGVLGVLGILAGAKLFQKPLEQKVDKNV